MTHCPHPTTTLRKRRNLYGQWRVAKQCDLCRCRVGSYLRLRHGQAHDFPLWLPSGKRRPTARRRDYLRRFREPDWPGLRDQVLRRDGYRCKLRYRDVCIRRATQAHHVDYQRFETRTERLEDLVAACAACNIYERELRITGRVLGTAARLRSA